MSNHITDWLNAYLDGELHGNRLHHVEAHLAECEICQTELDSLEKLSDLLQEVPPPEFASPERLAAQVSRRLPHPKPMSSGKKVFEISWWMIPVGLLATWGFINTSFFINDLLSVANSFGLLTSVSDWWIFSTSKAAGWSETLGQVGVLSGNILDFAVSTETFTRTSLLQITLQISIALLYLSWIAIWWTRHTRRGHGQPLES
jgi:predicted anti-sigma-YlaC factor YlaD